MLGRVGVVGLLQFGAAAAGAATTAVANDTKDIICENCIVRVCLIVFVVVM